MAKQATNDEEELRRLEHESHEAFLRGDAEVLERMLADDFLFTDPDGRMVDKAGWISDMTRSDVVYESFEIDDLRVRVYGDAAVTNGRVSVRARSAEQVSEERYCYTATYVRLEGRWRVVAEQVNVLTATA
jgi:ketosteroid isomerase-like protein